MFVPVLLAGALMTEAVTASPPPATAPSPAPAQPAMTYAPAKAADQKDGQLVCRTEAVLGSRLPVRRCRTVGDIKDRSLQDRAQVEHDQANLQWRSN